MLYLISVLKKIIIKISMTNSKMFIVSFNFLHFPKCLKARSLGKQENFLALVSMNAEFHI